MPCCLYPLTTCTNSEYKALAIEPLSIKYKSHTVHSTPAPSSGSIVLSALNTLSGYDEVPPVDSAITLHRTAEALKVCCSKLSG